MQKIKNMFQKYTSIFLLVIFVAYSGGVGFSLHYCEHCQKVDVYLFPHPDCCCPASKTGHHHGKLTKNDENCCSDDEDQQSPIDIPKSTSEAYSTHCKQCCVLEFVYFKIKSDYRPHQYNKFDDNTNKIASFDLLWNTEKPHFEANNTPLITKEPPPLLSSGKQFILYSHQLLFYA